MRKGKRMRKWERDNAVKDSSKHNKMLLFQAEAAKEEKSKRIKSIREDFVFRRYGKHVKTPSSPVRKHRGY